MTNTYEVRNTEMSDLGLIYELFEQSINYQEKNGYPVWRNYDRIAIIKDIENKNQYKVIIDSSIAIVFSVGYSDKIIWRQYDQGNSLYLHRIVVNPKLKGQRLIGKIVDWAIHQCKQRALNSIRMDTWANNASLIEYYKAFGFTVIENYTTPDTIELPVHNRKLALTLLEFKI